ncbi:vacuolar membrane-associated protein iml1 [Chytridiales sp. JEL 0842]|nr:vacuolar membrane-associated protein iml1 [Chytridiales sp. JEL 0842]
MAPQYTLWVHDERYSKEEVVVHPDVFPNVQASDILELFHPSAAKRHGAAAHRLFVQVKEIDHEIAVKQPQLQISIAQHLAAMFGLQARTNVVVRKIDKASISADFLELSFRDQYIARSDMWRLKMSLNNTCIYQGKKIVSLGVRAQIKDLIVNGRQVSCAYITDTTKAIFRSESAKYFLFIQMSKEMWEFDEDGELYFEKCVHGFLPDLFASWKRTGTNHVVSIVLFTRIFFKESTTRSDEQSEPLLRDSSGRMYRDFYRVVVDWETRSDWAQVLIPLKKEFIQFEKDVLQRNGGDGSFVLSGTNSPSSEGNLLEAINLALNPFDKHYIDRDLLRTGLSIVVVTPSPGLFEVDKKLCRLTTQRMIDNGIGCDIVSLSKPPLYTVPLFQFISKDPYFGFTAPSHLSGNASDSFGATSDALIDRHHDHKSDNWDPLYYDATSAEIPERTFFTIPTWVEISFYQRLVGNISFNPDKFAVRSKMYELQMIGIMETAGSMSLDYLDPKPFQEVGDESDPEHGKDIGVSPYAAYDEVLFASDIRKLKPLVFDEQNVRYIAGGPFPYSDYSSDPSQVASRPSRISSSPEPHKVSGRSGGSLTNAVDSEVTSSGGGLRDSRRGVDKRHEDGLSEKSGTEVSNLFSKLCLEASSKMNPTSIAPIYISENRNKVDDNNTTTDIERFSGKSMAGSGSYKGMPSPIWEMSRNIGRVSPGKALVPIPRIFPSRQNYINPCNPTKNIIRQGAHIRRWQHLFPNLIIAPTKNEPITKWKSLTTPACLPLTTDFFPSMEDLAQLYVENTYSVTPADDVNPFQDDSVDELQKVEALLVELISQRLSQGFQIIISNVIDGSQKVPMGTIGTLQEEYSVNPSGSLSAKTKLPGVSAMTRIPTIAPYFLSLGDHVHRLYFDASGKNVEVKRYMRKSMPFYEQTTVTFSYPPLAYYNWNYLDHLISGFQDEMTEGLRFWRARFLLIPLENLPRTNAFLNPSNENLDEEELRLVGFHKFVELFEKARWREQQKDFKKVDPKINQIRPVSSLNIQFTTLSLSSYVKEESQKGISLPNVIRQSSSSVNDAESDLANSIKGSLSRGSSLHAITQAMQNPRSGCPIKDRRWHFRLYENVFIGGECVEWMLREFEDIDTREDAITFGNELLSKGIFEHANKKHRFLDGHYFYRLNKEYLISKESLTPSDSATASGTPTPSRQRANTIIRKVLPEWSTSQTDLLESGNSKMSPIKCDRRIVIDMDPQMRSTRRETAILLYDTVHNSKSCWSRIAEKCGFKLVEAPVEQAKAFSNDNPLQSVIPIRLAAPPPTTEELQEMFPQCEFPPQFCEVELLKRFGFVPDMEADSLFPPNSILTRSQYPLQPKARYPTELDERDGFIHLSTNVQALKVANLYFSSSQSLIILKFSASKLESLGATLKWEAPAPPDESRREEERRTGELFPHLYVISGITDDMIEEVIEVHRSPTGDYDFILEK